MTDILERLRALQHLAESDQPFGYNKDIFGCAADEIERLRTRLAIQFGMHQGGDLAKAAQAKIERLRAALQDIAEDPYAVDGGAAEIARRALEPSSSRNEP